MIDPPRRSVTHFLVPFIDVTLILFSMFLLLPMGTSKDEEQAEKVEQADITEMQIEVESLQQALRDRKRELDIKNEQLEEFQKNKDVYKKLVEIDNKNRQLKEDIAQLIKERDLAKKTPNFVRVIDIDPKNGKIFFFDPFRFPDQRIPIPDDAAAKMLIERHKKEASDRQLFYHFMFPRDDTGYPTKMQEGNYIRWFAEVPNSLTEKTP